MIDLLVGNLLRLAQVAAGVVVPFTGLLSLLDFDVQSQVEPFQAAARTMHFKRGKITIHSKTDVIDQVRDLRAESSVGNIIDPPHQRCLRH
jgi:hypothetical protein